MDHTALGGVKEKILEMKEKVKGNNSIAVFSLVGLKIFLLYEALGENFLVFFNIYFHPEPR